MRRELAITALMTVSCVPPTTYGLRTDGALGDPGDATISASGMVVSNPDVGTTLPGGEIEGVYVVGPGTALSAAGGSVNGFAHAQADLRVGTSRRDAPVLGLGIFGAGAVLAEELTVAGLYGGGLASFRLTPTNRLYVGAKLNPVGVAGIGTWWWEPAVGATHRWEARNGAAVTVGAEVAALVPMVDYAAARPLYATQAWLTFLPPPQEGPEAAWDDESEPPED